MPRPSSISDDEERMSVGSRGSLRVEERPDRDFLDKGSRTASTLSAATLASLGGASSRRGSCDTSFSVETEASIREIKDSLAEAEEKYRKAMVSNAQLHNEKSTLMYQVDTLREELSDMEEVLWEARRHCDDTTKEFERERQARSVLQFQFEEMKETLRQTEELLTEVSDLRLKSSSYCQEVSDLQEALQWKEKKIGALERQREISDIVRIERDRLRGEVIRLRDLLKKHGGIVSSEITTNGEAGQGAAEDDFSAESSHGGRESTLGKVREWQPAEGSKLSQDYVKYNRWRIYKRSQSLNVVSVDEQTKPDTLKQVKRADELARETQDRTEKHPGRNKSARKLPRNSGSEKDLTKKFTTRQEGDLFFRKEGTKKQLVKNDRQEVRKVETKQNQPGSKAAQLVTEDQALKGRTKPESEPSSEEKEFRVDISAVLHRDVLAVEEECSFDDRNCKIQTNLGGTRPLACQLEGQAKEVVSTVRRASTEKVLRSRLVPPRSVKDIILNKKAIVSSISAAGKPNSLTQEKPKQDVTRVVGNVTSASDRDFAQKCSSAVDISFQNQEKDVKTSTNGRCSQREVLPDIPALCAKENKINEISTPTSVNGLKENEFVDELSEIEVSENLGCTLNEGNAFENEGDFSCSCVSEGLSYETKVKTSELDAYVRAEEAVIGERLSTLEELMKQRIYEEEPGREAVQIQKMIQDISFECKEQTKTPKLSTVSPFVPSEMLKTIQSLVRAFVENQGFVAEISRIVPEIPRSLNRWISELEDVLKNAAGNVDQHDTDYQESPSQMKLTSESELPLKDLPEGSKTPEDPEDVEESTAGHSTTLKDGSVPGILEVPLLAVQTYDVFVDSSGSRSKGGEDIQDLRERDDREATDNTLEGVSSTCSSEVEVVESSQEGKSGVKSDEKQSESDAKVTNCCQDFVIVKSYFAEPVSLTRVVASALDQGLVDVSKNPKTLKRISVVDNQGAEVVAKTNEQRPIVDKNQSCLVGPVEDPKDIQLKRHRTLSANSYVDQSSKIRRLIEITADEIEAMAVPELALMSLREGRILEDRQIQASQGSNTDDLEDMLVEDMDSCEEADETAVAQQPAMHQPCQPVTEVVVEDVKVVTVASSMKHLRGVGLDNRKDEHKTECQIS
ncbi:flagellar attachment zone protein 1 isoform X2 [Xiphias gladius]|uniref:flagellar attachment zone protein 1 isoform X2 n=1 Tax=Xiphias gladius TaxID=8245 RepID=UPI001A9932F2|nr:flagellar attachment zone protein 1 isoform X2 [Xiphias gladius]